MQEKRSAKRLPSNQQSSLKHENGNETDVTLIDISLGGMRVLMNEDLAVGKNLAGKFKILPHANPFYIQGIVAWTKPSPDEAHRFEIGIKFVKISTIPI
jgi:Tfp pilus assembly protein PilZ